MWRALASNMLTMLVVGLFLLGGVILWGKSQYTAGGPLETAICLRVERGSNMTKVSRDLETQGAVTSGAMFRLGAKYSERTGDLKAGSFLVNAGSSMEQIVEQVTTSGASSCGTEIVYRVGITRITAQVRELDPASNKFVKRADFQLASDEIPAIYTDKRGENDTRYRIALAEGVTSWQVVEALKMMDMLEGDPGIRPAEGMLAPDSYEVVPGAKRVDILAEMQSRQMLRINAAWEARTDGLPLANAEEMLILASIIEKETGVPSERRQVASVFTNRLNRGMRLQTDPTVIYGVTKGEGILGRGLRQSELRKLTPWNTYVIEGLPPTPIANPGMASLEAAVNPDQTKYVFFVADGTGGHAFAETLNEHNRNVKKWRAIEAERQNN
ncbi:endolytic transglycosylase MltG [Parasedimentitalea psychrophila]|uniref:Endolytic murein transglycosylase n=1 Tax=Parasedimentitalea psychrophila TaxID=2997337 RepID=A0A9Y2P625_9RHOB|nr:endolytic transglycosylase MltG [Parasedimentitalea psychrophila]WIY24558.1 endolytic transglycosylase MltG [Parasedimentitalea psychrophila]